MKRVLFLAFAALLFSAVTAVGQDVRYNFDKNTDFSKFKTYKWVTLKEAPKVNDLVNKQITEQTIRRQQEIMTRLLETEKSLREQNMDDERKGETAKDYDKEIPRAFEEYLRLKEKEVELLKTIPPKLYPYYKKEVGEYFKRIGNHN